MIKKTNKFSSRDFKVYSQNIVDKKPTKIGVFYFLKPEFGKSAIVVPKKYHKTAVSRNIIKRIFYRVVAESSTPLLFFCKGRIDRLTFYDELSNIVSDFKNRT